MIPSTEQNSVETQSLRLRDRGAAVVAIQPDELGIQAIGGVLYMVSPDGTLTAIGLGGGGITALTGDVTASGSGSVVATIAGHAVTYAKMQQAAANSFLGNPTGSTADVQEMSAATARTVLGLAAIATSASAADLTSGTLSASRLPAFTGDVTTTAGSSATTLATVNADVGTFTYGTFTVNAKGLITAASSGATPEVPLTFSTGLTRATNTITANLSTGVNAATQTAIGGTLTTQGLVLRPNAADTNTGKVFFGGAATSYWDASNSRFVAFASSSTTVAAFGVQDTTNGLGYTGTYTCLITGGALTFYGNSTAVYAAGSDYRGATGGTSCNIGPDVAGTLGLRHSPTTGCAVFNATSGAQFLRLPFYSFTAASSVRAQANGEVMAFAITPPNIASAAGAVLNAYRWDSATVTITGNTNITTAAGFNLIDIEQPQYTSASALTIGDAATLTIKGGPLAAGGGAGKPTVTNAYGLWVQDDGVRIDAINRYIAGGAGTFLALRVTTTSGAYASVGIDQYYFGQAVVGWTNGGLTDLSIGGGTGHSLFLMSPMDGIAAGGTKRMTIDATGLSFFTVAASAGVAQQTSGADLTNNVTSGGTDNTIADFTSLTVYATDAATIRNDIYQLARKLKQINDGLRAYGLFT